MTSSNDVPAGAFSSHARHVLHSLLCHVTKSTFDYGDDDALNSDDAPANEAADAAIPVTGTTRADTLTAPQIADLVAIGDDPFAQLPNEDLDAQPHGLHSPSRDMFITTRFGTLFTDPDREDAILGNRALTLLRVDDAYTRERLWRLLPTLLNHLSATSLLDVDPHDAFEICMLETGADTASLQKRCARTFADEIDDAIAGGKTIVALADHLDHLSAAGQTVCGLQTTLPDLSAAMVVEILRITHSATGQLAEEALLNALPGDADLHALPLALLRAAFLETTTLRVADALMALVERQVPAPTPLTLRNVFLAADIHDDLSQLAVDVTAWQSGHLDWQDVSSSVFLHGPPGNGKTLAAQALAGSAGIPLISTSYADCARHGHQGDFLKALADKVNEAVAHAPCVFFIDEMDSFTHRTAPNRSTYIVGIINGLLEHLTRLNDTRGVLVIAAANHPEMIDPALIRAGRFDLHLKIDSPDRHQLMRIMAAQLGMGAAKLDLHTIADQLIGRSGADVAALVRDAQGKARRDGTSLSTRHLQAAADRITQMNSPTHLHRIAVHEAGHVLAAYCLSGILPQRVRVTPMGGDVTTYWPTTETAETVRNFIAIKLAGRAAEELICGQVSSGVTQDLIEATQYAYMARYSWGLKDSSLLGLPFPEIDPNGVIGKQLNHDLKIGYSKAQKILSHHEAVLRKVTDILLARREVSGDDLKGILAKTDPRTAIANGGDITAQQSG